MLTKDYGFVGEKVPVHPLRTTAGTIVSSEGSLGISLGKLRMAGGREGNGAMWSERQAVFHGMGSAPRRTDRLYGVRRGTARFEGLLRVRHVESGDDGRYFQIALRLLGEMGDEAPAFVQARIDELFDQADPEMVEWAMIRSALALSMDGSRAKHRGCVIQMTQCAARTRSRRFNRSV
ncbi:hypothetical protein HL653_22830 [Sphingomonas sp. AP4-R1]|uniref:hypothetical protein n=1 Tax=Sphingomonas sp. AP4-R1 TaxID=2735134 RepID=UPI001493C65A|nr:hypothetical protein [Sphingomonas sp. AP4-R1]QJU60196.1 hypothetical protein HL653_22830 [Sphingomonas sp. AP4-R1]